MKTIGIIAEYNPFHNGHLYQIEQAKKITGADYVVVVMSGDYVQRGTPAVLEKHTRAKMALSHGADLVLELPVLYATSSAENFAYGAVSMLNRLGMIDYLCFGSECGDLAMMQEIADILLEEPASYQYALKDAQKQGLTFPAARANALIAYLGEVHAKVGFSAHETLEQMTDVLSSPNNILGIEYLKAIKRLNSTIQPMTIKREGAGYHSEDKTASMASATAIRKQLNTLSSDMWTALSELPNMTKELLMNEYQKTYPVSANDFSNVLYYQLMNEKAHLTRYLDVNHDLANRISNLVRPGIAFDSFCEEIKTKQITHSRVSRALLHILLGIKESFSKACIKDEVLYGRVLGFCKSSSILLKTAQQQGSLPLIVKVADAKELLTEKEYELFLCDINASHLYHQIVFTQYQTLLSDEYTTGPVIL